MLELETNEFKAYEWFNAYSIKAFKVGRLWELLDFIKRLNC